MMNAVDSLKQIEMDLHLLRNQTGCRLLLSLTVVASAFPGHVLAPARTLGFLVTSGCHPSGAWHIPSRILRPDVDCGDLTTHSAILDEIPPQAIPLVDLFHYQARKVM